jgi:hypothetical protein
LSTPKIAQAISFARVLPRPLRALLAGSVAHCGAFGSTPDAARKASAAVADPDALPHPYFFTRLLFPPESIRWRPPREAAAWRNSPSFRCLSDSAVRAQTMDDFTAVSWLELRSYMLNTLLRDTDAMSMRHSLEVRVPFLHAPLVDYLLSLPAKAKHPTARPKSLLVEALADIFPDEILAQRKRTFTFPWENWLRGPLAKRVAAGIADWSPSLEQPLPGEFAQKVWSDFLARRTTWSRPWGLYVLNEWVKRNVDAGSAVAPGVDQPKSAAVAIS